VLTLWPSTIVRLTDIVVEKWPLASVLSVLAVSLSQSSSESAAAGHWTTPIVALAL
jgi:hypothetical protein